MDFEELESILRSRQTEPTEAVMVNLMAAIGRQTGLTDPQIVQGTADELAKAFWNGFISGRNAALQAIPMSKRL